MTGLSHLRALQALELAIRKGSLKAAAKELSISPAAVGQRIRALEDYLGFDLLVRGRSGIRPTRELEGALAHLNAGFRELATVSDILDFQRVNEVHITADPDWAELWLRPRLKAFGDANRNILFCLNGTGDVPTRLGDADCEIWFGEQRGGGDQALLFHDYLLPVGSPVNTRRILRQPAELRLEGFPLLHLDSYTREGGAIGWPEWIGKYGYRKTAPGLGIRYKRLAHALEAVYADSGLLVCGLALVAPQIRAGMLEMPFPVQEGEFSRSAYRVSFSPNALRREPIKHFRQWLLEQASETKRELAELTGKGVPAPSDLPSR